METIILAYICITTAVAVVVGANIIPASVDWYETLLLVIIVYCVAILIGPVIITDLGEQLWAF